MKRYALLLTAALGMAAAQSAPTPSQPAAPVIGTAATPLSARAADPLLSNSNVTVEIGRYGGPLSSLLAAIAKAAGYGLVLDANVDALGGAASAADPAGGTAAPPAAGTATPGTARPVVYAFQNKPFNQVWPLLMDVYGLSYEVVQLGGQPVLRVSNTPIQRVVPLRNADATQASTQVKLFFGTPTYSETPQRDAQGNTTGVTRTLADVKLDSPTLRVVPDVRSNSVIVRGTNKEVAEVERLLAQLDLTGGAGGAGTPEATQAVQRVYSVRGQQADITGLLGAQYPGLKVTPVGQTGQLVITGPQNQLDAALTLLGQVDRPAPPAQAGPQTVQRIFQLVNASAEEVKATLEGTLAANAAQGSPVQSVAGGALGSAGVVTGVNVGAAPTSTPTPATTPAGDQTGQPAQAGQVNNPSIIADKRTNTLIVRGTAEQVAQVAELIPTLDVRVPQINLQVRINEITETGLRTLGVGYKASVGGFQVSLAGGQLTTSFDPTRNFVGFNLGATLDNLEQQGLTKRVYDGTVMMQSGQTNGSGAGGGSFRCGSPDDQSNVAAASLQSGGRLDVNLPGQGGSAPVVRTIPYGVNMYFLDPSVNNDGTISVRLCGQVNQPRTAITNVVPNLLDFSNSSAQTVVNFKNGETLLLSGLLGQNEVTSRSGLPFLSSVPVVGALLGGRESVTKDSTQLLVVVTGNVVK